MTRMGSLPVVAALAVLVSIPVLRERLPAGSLQAVTEEGYFTGADGVRLFYRRLGSGNDVVVFLHGGPGLSMQDGGYTMDPLAGERTLIMYDQRGSGRSDLVKDTALLTADADVRDLEALRLHFSIKKMALIGNSWGAGLALLYTIAHPDHVSRIVFLSPMPPALTPYAQARHQRIQSLLAPADLSRLQEIGRQADTASDTTLMAMCADIMRIMFKPYLVDSTNYARRKGNVCDEPAAAFRNAAIVGAAVNGSLGNFDLRPDMRRVQVPALVIEGAESNVPHDATEEWVRYTRGAKILLVPHSGHAVFIDQPDALVADIRLFLSGTWPPTATERP